MSNILADPNLWSDLDSNVPPSYWDGSAYEFLGFFGPDGPPQVMNYVGSPADMPLSMTFSVTCGSDIYDVPTVLNVSMDDNFYEFPLTANTTEEFGIQTAGSTTLQFYLTSNAGGYSYTYSMDVTLTPGSAIDPAVGCDEIGRVSRVNVSAHTGTRVASVRLVPGAKRCLVANFNGAVKRGRTIVEARWQADASGAAVISAGAISADGRDTSVMVDAVVGPGRTVVQCTATLDNGERYPQQFVVEVSGSPFVPAGPLPVGSQLIVVTP